MENYLTHKVSPAIVISESEICTPGRIVNLPKSQAVLMVKQAKRTHGRAIQRNDSQQVAVAG